MNAAFPTVELDDFHKDGRTYFGYVELGHAEHGRIVVQAVAMPGEPVLGGGIRAAFRRLLVEDETYIPLAPPLAVTFGGTANGLRGADQVRDFLTGEYRNASAPHSLRTLPGAAEVFAPVGA